MSNQPFVPALDLESGFSSNDRGMRPTLIGAWKREKDEESFAFFMDVQRRSGLSLVQVMSIVKGIWEEDNEAVSWGRDAEGRIIKFRLNPKRKEEGETARKEVVGDGRVKIIKKGRQPEQVKEPVKRQAKRWVEKPVNKVKVKACFSRNGDNPYRKGFGIFITFEELTIGGEFDQVLARMKKRFKAEKIASDPENRLKRLIYVVDEQSEKQIKSFRVKRTGKLSRDTSRYDGMLRLVAR